jgi:hypothetical protein
MATVYKQPKFDAELSTNLRWPLTDNKDNLRRGYMVWDTQPHPPRGYTAKDAQSAVVQFLYNPSEISASYSIQFYGAAIQFPNVNDTATLRTGLSQTVNFTLLFDRTYAFWDNKGGDLAEIGVDVDVRQLKQFTGMFIQSQNQAQATGGKNAALSQGIMGRIDSYVVFSGSIKHGLIYYGFISSWDVTYTHFSNKMIPMRCSVDVSFTLLPPPTQANNKPGSVPTPVTTVGGRGGPTGGPVNGVGGR